MNDPCCRSSFRGVVQIVQQPGYRLRVPRFRFAFPLVVPRWMSSDPRVSDSLLSRVVSLLITSTLSFPPLVAASYFSQYLLVFLLPSALCLFLAVLRFSPITNTDCVRVCSPSRGQATRSQQTNPQPPMTLQTFQRLKRHPRPVQPVCVISTSPPCCPPSDERELARRSLGERRARTICGGELAAWW